MIAFDDILRMRQKELRHYLVGHIDINLLF